MLGDLESWPNQGPAWLRRPRVNSSRTLRENNSREGFQTAEYLLEHGFVDPRLCSAPPS